MRALLSAKVLAAALFAVGLGAAHAQYVGPAAGKATPTVKQILAEPQDDQQVRLQGNLIRQLGHEKYMFSDGTGEIIVEIDNRLFPSVPVDDKTRVELWGEVDTGLRRPPEIEVEQMKVLN